MVVKFLSIILRCRLPTIWYVENAEESVASQIWCNTHYDPRRYAIMAIVKAGVQMLFGKLVVDLPAPSQEADVETFSESGRAVYIIIGLLQGLPTAKLFFRWNRQVFAFIEPLFLIPLPPDCWAHQVAATLGVRGLMTHLSLMISHKYRFRRNAFTALRYLPESSQKQSGTQLA